LAFSDPSNEYDYLKKLYETIHVGTVELKQLQDEGFTVREIEILTGVSKSRVARELQE
jgi:predicted transcriptional regulator